MINEKLILGGVVPGLYQGALVPKEVGAVHFVINGCRLEEFINNPIYLGKQTKQTKLL